MKNGIGLVVQSASEDETTHSHMQKKKREYRSNLRLNLLHTNNGLRNVEGRGRK